MNDVVDGHLRCTRLFDSTDVSQQSTQHRFGFHTRQSLPGAAVNAVPEADVR